MEEGFEKYTKLSKELASNKFEVFTLTSKKGELFLDEFDWSKLE